MKRPGIPKRRTPKQRAAPRRVKGVARDGGKAQPPIDTAYRNRVRRSGCAVYRLSPTPHRCWGPVEFAHHPKTRNYGDTGVGLCTAMHTEYHLLGRATFQKKWAVDLDAEVQRLASETP